MAKERPHHHLPIRLTPGPNGCTRIVFGPTSQGQSFYLDLPAGNPEVRIWFDKRETPCLVFRFDDGRFHVFKEVEAKESARESLGRPAQGSSGTNTREDAQDAWDQALRVEAEGDILDN